MSLKASFKQDLEYLLLGWWLWFGRTLSLMRLLGSKFSGVFLEILKP